MKLLLDECLPRKLKFLFAEREHDCQTVLEAGFGGKENGELLTLAEQSFDVFVTVDKSIPHQQKMEGRRIAVLVIRAISNDLEDLRPHIPAALVALRSIQAGQVAVVGGPE